MKALTYHGSKDVRVETVPDPRLLEADDIVLRVTATAICGSDLHIFRGRIPTVETGDILGHEFMGIVENTGPGVTRLRRGDRVVVPFTIACGDCLFCTRSLFSACETSNTGRGAIVNTKPTRPGAALFGYSHLYGGVPGGQAEYVRVPKANVGPLVIPDSSLSDEQVLFLSDILPTGYQAALNGGVERGSTVAILGAGPVGLMAAASCRMLGAERIFMVDHHPYRLEYAARTYGVEPIDFDEHDDPAEIIIERTDRRGVDCTIDAVGFEVKGSTVETVPATMKPEGSSGKALRQAIAATRRGGTVSVPGVYAGFIHGVLFGGAFEKGLTFKGGQTHAHRRRRSGSRGRRSPHRTAVPRRRAGLRRRPVGRTCSPRSGSAPIGAQAIARAMPEGHTLPVGSATTNATHYAFFPGRLPCAPTDFELVAPLGGTPQVLWFAAAEPAIAVAAEQRSTVSPDVPTFRELGHPDIVMTAWSEIFAPRSTPAPVMERLSAALKQADASPAAVESRRRSGGVDLWRSLPESRAYLASQIARWERHVRDSGVEPECQAAPRTVT